MSDTITFALPESGKDVVIRNYTTRADDKQADKLINAGMTIEVTGQHEQKILISAEATEAAAAKYVELLVESIDGEPVTSRTLEELRSADYRAISVAVATITGDASKGASKA